MSYKNFKSKFNVLCEEETSRYKNGGVLMGDFVKILPNALNHPKLKDRPSNFIDKLKEFMKSGQPLKVSVVKTDRPATSNGLVTAGEGPDGQWVDVVREYAPGLFADVMTLPLEVIEVITPEGNNWSPDHPADWKYDNKEQIEPKDVKDAEGELEHQTQGSKRKTATKDTKGITKGTAKAPKVTKPVEYKESTEYKSDNELLVEAYGKISDIRDRRDRYSEVNPPEVMISEPEEEIEEDIFEKYGSYAKQYDGLVSGIEKEGKESLTPGELNFVKTFQALLSGDASVDEMKLAHRHWMEEDNQTEADKVRSAYLGVQSRKI